MFVYGGDSVRDHVIYDEIMESLTRAGKNIVEFSGIMDNPTYEKVLEGAELAREEGVDFILAVGGGSEMNGRAVITNKTLKVRTGRDYPKCNPKFALIDPVYSCDVSKRQIRNGEWKLIQFTFTALVN